MKIMIIIIIIMLCNRSQHGVAHLYHYTSSTYCILYIFVFYLHVYLPALSTGRSEEHTSELQSRPHISYAVFCLKKKKKKKKKEKKKKGKKTRKKIKKEKNEEVGKRKQSEIRE